MRRIAWTFAARIGDKYQIRLTRPNLSFVNFGVRWNWYISEIYIIANLLIAEWVINHWLVIIKKKQQQQHFIVIETL